ncbi:MAG: hypothetical protein SNH63_02660 [Rikenellaceae bacterium]
MIKKIEVVALTLLMIVSVSCLFAQPQQQNSGQQRQRLTSEQRAKMETDSLTRVLTLSDKQSAKVLEISLANGQKADSLMSKGERSREMMEQVRALETVKIDEIKKILDKTQVAAYEKLIAKQAEEQAARREQRGNGQNGSGRPSNAN